jgi:hypothetical protein
MPHVGDGEIHAYLDGALDLFPLEDAERIRDHLRSCPDCGRRLDEEKGLREGAEAILGAAGPEVGEMPPFEEIRARAVAATPAPRGRRVPPTLLPWAASIVLAVAVGWGTRGAMLSRTVGAPDVATQSAIEGVGGRGASAEPVSTEVLDAIATGEADAVTVRSAELTPTGDIRADADPIAGDAFRAVDAASGPEVAEAQDAPAQVQNAPPRPSSPRSNDLGAMAKSVAEAAAEESPADDEEVAPQAPAESEVTAFADRREPDREAEEPADVQARRALAESSSALAPAQERFDEANERVAQQPGEGGELRARAGAFESSAVSPAGLMVPGLPVESIAVDPALGPTGGLRIVQRLPGGERLELLFISGGADAQYRDEVATARLAGGDRVAAPDETEEWSRIEVPRSGGLLIARSAVPGDSLAALVAHLR